MRTARSCEMYTTTQDSQGGKSENNTHVISRRHIFSSSVLLLLLLFDVLLCDSVILLIGEALICATFSSHDNQPTGLDVDRLLCAHTYTTKCFTFSLEI